MSFLALSLILDLFLLIVVGYFIFRGTKRGAVSCLFSLLALCMAFPIACYFFPLLAGLFPQKVANRILSDSVAFAIILIAFYFLTLILIWAILKAFKRFREDISDQIAGGILGFLKGTVIIFIAILLIITLLPNKSPLLKGSFLSRSTISIVNAIAKPFPRSLRQKFNQKKKELVLYWRQTGQRR